MRTGTRTGMMVVADATIAEHAPLNKFREQYERAKARNEARTTVLPITGTLLELLRALGAS